MSLFPGLTDEKFYYGTVCEADSKSALARESGSHRASVKVKIARNTNNASLTNSPVLRREDVQAFSSERQPQPSHEFLDRLRKDFQDARQFASLSIGEAAKLMKVSASTLEKFLSVSGDATPETVKKVLLFRELIQFLRKRNRNRKYAVVPLFRMAAEEFGSKTPLQFAELTSSPLEDIFGIFKRLFE